jgi:hypothetical protein
LLGTPKDVHLAHSVRAHLVGVARESMEIQSLMQFFFLCGFLSNELGDVALFVNGLSVLIGLALLKLHGLFADDALWSPLAFGYMFG